MVYNFIHSFQPFFNYFFKIYFDKKKSHTNYSAKKIYIKVYRYTSEKMNKLKD